MNSDPSQSDMDAYYAQSRRPLFRQPTTRLGKAGCGILLVLWFVLLSTPCAMFWLATGSSIRIPSRNIPEPDQHPMIEIRLVMEEDNRGLQFTRSRAVHHSVVDMCVAVSVNYFLWESDGTDNGVTYCQCYERSEEVGDWQFVYNQSNNCS